MVKRATGCPKTCVTYPPVRRIKLWPSFVLLLSWLQTLACISITKRANLSSVSQAALSLSFGVTTTTAATASGLSRIVAVRRRFGLLCLESDCKK